MRSKSLSDRLADVTKDLVAAQALIEEANRHKRVRRFRIIAIAVLVALVGSLFMVSQVGSGRHQPDGSQALKTAPSPVSIRSASPWGPPVQVISGAGAVWVTMSAPAKQGLPPAPSAVGGIVRFGLANRPSVRNWAPLGAPQASVVANGSIWTAGFNTGFVSQVDVRTGHVERTMAHRCFQAHSSIQTASFCRVLSLQRVMGFGWCRLVAMPSR